MSNANENEKRHSSSTARRATRRHYVNKELLANTEKTTITSVFILKWNLHSGCWNLKTWPSKQSTLSCSYFYHLSHENHLDKLWKSEHEKDATYMHVPSHLRKYCFNKLRIKYVLCALAMANHRQKTNKRITEKWWWKLTLLSASVLCW